MAVNALSALLPEPKHKDDYLPLVDNREDDVTSTLDSSVVVQVTGAPAYGQRSGWMPRTLDDFGDGGSFPEIHIAQYPLEMGKANTVITIIRVELMQKSTSNALQVQVDAQGRVQYDAIVRQGHDSNRIIHTSFKDLIPLRQRADVGEIDLA